MSNIKLSGMSSGLDTDSIITALVSVKQEKVDAKKLEQKKFSWQQDTWKSLNTKIYSLFNGTLEKLRYESSYQKKTTKLSIENAASIVTGDNAVNGTQALSIDQLAKTAYLTGSKLAGTTDYSSSTLLSSITDSLGAPISGALSLTKDGVTKQITLPANAKISDVISSLKAEGLNANFDAKNQRFFVSSKASGAANDFTFSGTGNIMAGLGLDAANTDCTKVNAQDASITLNGATFTSNTNVFEINGLTITANFETTVDVVVTTLDDTAGIYDLIKGFINEYSSVINEMDKIYNADSADKYPMLSDEKKDAMSDDEITEWEQHIKDALLRGDSTLSSLSSAMKSIMLTGVVIDGTTKYMSDFGINTLSYFNAPTNEKNAYHINGDSDDSKVSGETNALMAAISTSPTSVVDFFTELSKNMHDKLNSMMASTSLSSIYSVYNDKKMKEDYNEYTTEIADMESTLSDYEARYYSKFSKMEVALSKLNSNSSAITSLLGTSSQ